MIKTNSLAVLIGVIEMVKVGQQIIENSLFTNPHASFFVYGLIFCAVFCDLLSAVVVGELVSKELGLSL